jgi:hypothetical protein
MFRNVRCGNLRDVTGDFMVASKVGAIGLLRILVHLAGEDALSTNCVEATPEAPDSSEQIDELEGCFGVFHECFLLACRHNILGLGIKPSADAMLGSRRCRWVERYRKVRDHDVLSLVH